MKHEGESWTKYFLLWQQASYMWRLMSWHIMPEWGRKRSIDMCLIFQRPILLYTSIRLTTSGWYPLLRRSSGGCTIFCTATRRITAPRLAMAPRNFSTVHRFTRQEGSMWYCCLDPRSRFKPAGYILRITYLKYNGLCPLFIWLPYFVLWPPVHSRCLALLLRRA